MAMLHEQTQMDANSLGMAAKQVDERFADIKSPKQALDMLNEASRRLSPEMFEEFIDQTEEYGTNIAAAGVNANDERAAFPGLEWKYTRAQVGQHTSFDAKAARTLAD
jgi:hypothetical protein